MHSNRTRLHWTFVVVEVVLFVAATTSAYLSETQQWTGFVVVAVIATLLFALVKAIDALPAAKELLARDDMAARMADSAERYGVHRYFNMQSARDQALRNEATQAEVANAQSMCLCANSGASYLDPSTYRHWPRIEKRLQAGVSFRVVLLDPCSREKLLRNRLNVGGEALDSKLNLASIIKLYNLHPTLEVRFVTHGMHATVFATENRLFFDPYHIGLVGQRIENRSFCLEIVPSTPEEGVGLYQLFKSHFDTLWRTSVSLEEWITSQSQLPPGLPAIQRR